MKIDKKVLVCGMIDAGVNNRELSKLSGVSPARISNIKNGANTTFETVSKLAKALNIPIQDFIVFEERK